KGVVVDESNEPIVGVSVMVKGNTAIGAVTNIDGQFTLDVPNSATTLIVKYLGMEDQEVTIAPDMRVVMKVSAKLLDEVIVVAYGTVKKQSYTGSASTIRGEKIAKMQVSNVTKSLEGAVPGLQTFSSSGQPGSSSSLYLRGLGSLLASSNPLIVLDGVPYEGNLNQINSQDIENVSVLKDAAASSLYGARGSNGVIIITTKKGASGKATVSFENRTGFNSLGVPKYAVLDSPKEYYELFWEATKNQMVYGGAGYTPVDAGIYASNHLISDLGGYNNYNVPDGQLIDPYTGRLNPNAKLLYHDDWFDEAFRSGFRQENNISVSGGSDKTKYFASVNYLNENSYTEQSNLERISARLNLDQEVKSWFKMGFNMAFANVATNSPNVGGTNYSSIFMMGQQVAPIYPVYEYDADGNRKYDANGNPVYDYGVNMGKRPYGANSSAIDQQKNDIRETTVDVINAKAYADFKFLNHFTLTLNASIDNFNTTGISFQTPIGGDAYNVGGRSTKEMQRYYVLNANQLLNYSQSFDDVHQVDVLLGHETKKDRVSNLWARKENFLIPDNPELANAAVLSDASSSSAEYSLEGYFSQIKYNYNEKYYISASYRRDASSKFHPDVRWGDFFSAGLAWRLSQENFLNTVEWINDLKIRSSYGTQGNDNVNNNQPYKDQYEVVNQDGVIGINYIFRGVPNLTWEKSKMFDVALEFKLFDKLSGVVNYFYKDISSMLYAKPLPPSKGRPSSIWENSMGMTNNGIEVELNWDIFSTNDFKWNLALNATHYKTKLSKLPADRPQDGWATGNYFRKIGSGAYNYYYYKYAGVDPVNGDPLYYADVKDEEGNVTGTETVNTTDLATRYDLGKSAVPDVYGGISTYVEFKGFDFSANAAYQIGGWVFDSPYASFMSGGNAGQNFHKDVYKRWTPDNPNTDVPRLQAGYLQINSTSDRFLTKGTHLTLRNMTVGYTFPRSFLSKTGIEKLRVYVVGDNLWLFSARQGFDPRQSFSGSTGYAYSPMRTVSFGLNLNF
ncbi:MAG: TonB-dependent receptor, partial [Dysgonamonadaceae bacterium]|nr:TonB-dependent receptor [Dysgonamonadaceae bacterium]